MNMFSSPAFRIFSSENSESMVQRKPGANNLLPRKPFVDKTVNCNTPDVNRKLKSTLTIKESVKTPSPTLKTPNLEIPSEDRFSYKEVDDQYEDLLPHTTRLEHHHVYNILKNYLVDNTPPPSPTFKPIPVEEISFESEFNNSFNSNESYDEDDMFFNLPEHNNGFKVEEISEIDLPVFDIDDL